MIALNAIFRIIKAIIGVSLGIIISILMLFLLVVANLVSLCGYVRHIPYYSLIDFYNWLKKYSWEDIKSLIFDQPC
jgi:hypothetical protein